MSVNVVAERMMPAGGYWKLDQEERAAFRRKLRTLWQWPENRTPTERQMIAYLQTFNRTFKTPILFGGAMGGAKLLQWDTMIPTPDGFRRIDDLRVGDIVLGRSGQPTLVHAVSEPQIADAYKLTFDDGSSLVAHAGHEWLTYNRAEMVALHKRTDDYRDRRRRHRSSRAIAPDTRRSIVLAERNRLSTPSTLAPPTGTVRTTAEILRTLRTKEGWANHAIPVADPIDLPTKNLPLDPYVLGCWLGDGTTADGSITTMDSEIVDAVERAGFSVSSRHQRSQNRSTTYRFKGLKAVLREIGVLNEKHTPDVYLWSSAEQRLAVLQGLLDTDGSCNERGGVEFSNTNERLTRDVAHLARSLGNKVTIREGRALLNGKDCGPIWSVKFMSRQCLFRLQRKAAKWKPATRQTTRFRYITDVTPIGPERMRCIAVGAHDHLYLAGEHLVPTHNTAFICALAISLSRMIDRNRVLICRKEFSALSASTLQELEEQLESCPDAVHWPGKHEVHFPNGSEIWYMGVGTPKQREKMGSTQFGAILPDEGTELDPDVVRLLQTRLRWGPAAKEKRLVLCFAGNPWPGWVKEQFITKQKEGYTFIPSRTADNPYIYEGYADDMRAEMPDEWYRAFVLGDWNAMVPSTAVIPYKLVQRARRRQEAANLSDITWGIDVGHLGPDHTYVCRRMGYKFDHVAHWGQKTIPETIDEIVKLIVTAPYIPHRIVVDYDGIGAGVADGLLRKQEEGVIPQTIAIIGVHAQKTATVETPFAYAPVRYANMKAQLGFEMRRLLESGHGDLPDDDDLEIDLTSANYDVIDGRVYIETKKLVRSKIGRSPDYGDAMLLTMYSSGGDEIAGLPSNIEQMMAPRQGPPTGDVVVDDMEDLTRLYNLQRQVQRYRDPFQLGQNNIIDIDMDLGYG